MKTGFVLAAIMLSFLAAPAMADSWLPFQDQRVVSPTGRTYVVIRARDRGISWELYRRAEGAAPMTNATGDDAYGLRKGTGGPIDADPADSLVGKGEVGQLPLRVRVLDEPAAFVLFEKYGSVGGGDSLIYVDGKRGVVFRRKLDQLFDADTRAEFRETVSSLWWHQGIAVDEEMKNILVVAAGDRLRRVGLAEGMVSTPEKEVLLRGFRRGPIAERELCLDAAVRLKPKGLHAEALAIAADEGEPVPLRLRAAVAVRRDGGNENFAPLFLKATEQGVDGEVRSYAVAHIAEVVGDDAMPMLRRLMRGEADHEVWHPAQMAFVSLKEKAVPTLTEMLLEEGESPDYRGGAAHALGKIGSPAAIDALLIATATAEDYVANAAVNAAIEIGAPDLDQRLAEILAKGSTQDGRIALYFEEHPSAVALEPLKKALARAEPGSSGQRRIENALKAVGALGGK